MAGPKIPQKYLDIADKSFSKKGVYRTAFALKLALRGDKKFKSEYEKYLLSKDKKAPYLGRWFKEEWVQVEPYLKDGSVIACGAERSHTSQHKGKACRPLQRIAASTPLTLPELVKKIGEKRIMEEVHKKQKNPSYRIPWHRLTKNGLSAKTKANSSSEEPGYIGKAKSPSKIKAKPKAKVSSRSKPKIKASRSKKRSTSAKANKKSKKR